VRHGQRLARLARAVEAAARPRQWQAAISAYMPPMQKPVMPTFPLASGRACRRSTAAWISSSRCGSESSRIQVPGLSIFTVGKRR